MKKIYWNKSGFTLAEILIAVMVMAILVTMAVPIYERAIEKSHVSEVGITLKRLGESKLRTMDTYQMNTFTKTGSFTLHQLDVQIPDNDFFSFYLYPASFPNSVCAVRSNGPNAGTKFLYVGEEIIDKCNCGNTYADDHVCTGYCRQGKHFFCQNASETNETCNTYGMDSVNIGECYTSTLE